MTAGDSLFGDEARTVILASVGLKWGESAASLMEELQATIPRLAARFTDSARENHRSLCAVRDNCRKLGLRLEALPVSADMELIDYFPGGERQDLLDGLERLDDAAENASKQFAPDGRGLYVNSKGAKQMVVRFLLPIFERYCVERPLLRGESKDYLCFCFLEPCLRAVGIERIPDVDRMISDYVRPARRSWQREADTVRSLVADVEKTTE